MAKAFRMTFALRMGNRFAATLVRAGVPFGNIALLTVRGRKSGKARTTPVAITEHDGQRHIVAAYGVVDWVRNLRAAGVATLTRGRRSESIRVVELAPEEAAPILKHGLEAGPSMLRPYFDATAGSSLQEFAREAECHPVFRILG